MQQLFVITLAFFLLFSCKNRTENAAALSADIANDSANHQPLYPFPQYIKNQAAYVDSTPLALEMTIMENGKLKNAEFISRNEFHALVNNFINPDPNEKEIRPFYNETSFSDLSQNNITFSISTKNNKLPLQQADILLNKDSHEVTNVILKKWKQYADTTEISILLWVNNLNFQIISNIAIKNGSTIDRILKVEWDKKREQN